VDSLGSAALGCIDHRRIHDFYSVVTVNAIVPYG
jgi:hypothetical protein